MFVPGIDGQADDIDGATQARRWAPAGHADLAYRPRSSRTGPRTQPGRSGVPLEEVPGQHRQTQHRPADRPGEDQAQSRLRPGSDGCSTGPASSAASSPRPDSTSRRRISIFAAMRHVRATGRL